MSEQEALSHAEPKNSGIGIASFVISITVGVLILVTISIVGVIDSSTPGGIDEVSAEAILLGFGLIGLLIIDLVALGLGIGALFQKEKKKILAILGTVFSFVAIVLTVLAGVL